MSDQYTMFEPAISPDTGNATSSPESASGVTRSGSLDGPKTGKFGPEAAPVSPSVQPAKAKRSTIRGIFGQSGFHSSRHDDLSFALASKLRPSTDSLGSTLYKLTWMTRATPAGRLICALRASELPIEDSVYIGWPTPMAKADAASARNNTAKRNKVPPTGIHPGETLTDAVTLAGWPTTQSRDSKNEQEAHIHRPQHTPDLSKAVLLAGWATPKVQRGDYQYNTGDHSSISLNLIGQAKLSGWTTPQAHDQTGRSLHQKEIHGTIHGCADLVNEARLTAFGETPIGFLLGPNGWEIVPASGQLNASHSRWLMGLPRIWDLCGILALRKLRRK